MTDLTTYVLCTTVVLWSQGAIQLQWSKAPMPLPNYAGRLLDKIILKVIDQTSTVKQNVDEPGYATARGAAMKATAWELFRVRNELQQTRRDVEKREKEKAAAAAKKDEPT
jgi:hypothetical protein